MIPELSDLLAMHDDPTTYSGEVIECIVDIIPRYGLDLILAQLPENWSRALITWIAAAYNSVHSQNELVHINNPGGPQQVSHIMEWIIKNPTFRSQVINDIPTLIKIKQNKIFSKRHLMDQLVRVSADQGVDTVVNQLPDSLRKAFIEWARAHFLHEDVPLHRPGERQVREWLTHNVR